MLDRIVAQIALALFSWLEKRIERGTVAVDADPDRDSLTRAGSRIREWMREQDRLRSGGKSDEGRSGSGSQGVPPG